MLEEEIEEYEKKASFSFRTWRKLFSYLDRPKRTFCIMMFFIGLMALLDVLFPLFQAWLVDGFLEPGSLDGIWIFGVAFFVLVAVQTAFLIVFLKVTLRFELDTSRTLRNKMFRKFQGLPVDFFDTRPVGYLVSKTMSDTDRVANVASWGAIDIGWQVVYIIGVFIPMFILNAGLAAIILCIIPFALLFSMIK
jgi:ATP-binding cassette subfamily B protein